MAQKYYAVRIGKQPGIYLTWAKCKEQVIGFNGALYKSFTTREEAESFMKPTNEVDYQNIKGPYAFVDGSYYKPKKTYGYGVCLSDGKKIHLYSGSGNEKDIAKLRNVSGEIKAAMCAVERAEELGIEELIILYDYIGIEAWAMKYFDTKIAFVQNYITFMNSPDRKVKVKFMRVPAHTGIAGNEIADILARNAAGHKIAPWEKHLLRKLDTENDVSSIMELSDFFKSQSC